MRTYKRKNYRTKIEGDRDTLVNRYADRASRWMLKAMFFSGLAWTWLTLWIGYFFGQ
ncbi:MAG: hypothetical protein AAF662_05265 [Pseudomonadota bacterium]